MGANHLSAGVSVGVAGLVQSEVIVLMKISWPAVEPGLADVVTMDTTPVDPRTQRLLGAFAQENVTMGMMTACLRKALCPAATTGRFRSNSWPQEGLE